MSWPAIMAIIVDETGPEVADRIRRRIEYEYGGDRVTVGTRSALTPEQVNAVGAKNPDEAARALGVHRSTVYRALNRCRLIR